jgi:hypothetical protein
MNIIPTIKIERHSAFHNAGDRLSEFYRYRNIGAIGVGATLSAIGIMGGAFNWIIHRTWTVSPWIFASVVLVGVVVIIMPRFFTPYWIPGSFVVEQMTNELSKELKPDKAIFISFQAPIELFSEAIRMFYGPIERSQHRCVSDNVREQANMLLSESKLMSESLLQLSDRPDEDIERLKDRLHIIHITMKSLQKNIETHTDCKTEIEYMWEKISRAPIENTGLEIYSHRTLEEAKTCLQYGANEKLDLKFRALFFTCLINLTFFPRSWRTKQHEVFELYAEAIGTAASRHAKVTDRRSLERQILLLEGDQIEKDDSMTISDVTERPHNTHV